MINYGKIKYMKIFNIIIISIFLTSSLTVLGQNINYDDIQSTMSQSFQQRTSNPYQGNLKIYIAEPVSRWDMYDGEPYHYGFLDFAYDNEITIDYQDTLEDTIVWNGDVSEDNVIVIASIFNSKSYTEYAYPPSTNRFDAYYVDASTGAKPGESNYKECTGCSE